MFSVPLIHSTLAGYLTMVELDLITPDDLRADLRAQGHRDICREVVLHFLPTCRDDHGRRAFVDPTRTRGFPRTEEITLKQLWQIVCHNKLRHQRRDFDVRVCGACEADARIATSSLTLIPPTEHLNGSLAARIATTLNPQWPQVNSSTALRGYDVTAVEAFWSKLSWVIRSRLVLDSAYDVVYDTAMVHRGFAAVLLAQDAALTSDFDRLSHTAPGRFAATEVASAWFEVLEAQAVRLRAKLGAYRPSWRTWLHGGISHSHRCRRDEPSVWVAAPNRNLTRGMLSIDEVDGAALAALATASEPLLRVEHANRVLWVARVCRAQYEEHMRWARHYGVPMHELTSADLPAEVVAAAIRHRGLPEPRERYDFDQFAQALAATSSV